MNEIANSGRAADFVVDQIEASILSGELVDGDALPPERDLMEQYKVSRTVIREAVAKLSGRGLLITKPRHRPIITKPGVENAIDAVGGIIGPLLNQPGGIKNLFDTRVLLEVALAREAATNADKTDIKRLKEALEANRLAINDSQKFYTTDVAFHSIFYSISNNPVLPAIHKAYSNWLAAQWQVMPRDEERNTLNYESHKGIVNAVLSRDPDEAELMVRKHLEAAWKQVKNTFQSE